MTPRSSSFVADLDSTLKARRLLAGHAHILVAVSGGADSVALLLGLHAVQARLGFQITVAHLDHRLRGAEARADMAFVVALADRLKVACVTGRSDVRGLARRKGISIEMAAREARYRLFSRTARRVAATAVATAHTADDQAETVLLRLARGSGATGLGGIRWSGLLSDRVPGASRAETQVIRPLLGTPRGAVETFLRERGECWREDASNRSMAFLRNRVRHELLPWLEERLNPSVREALWRTADILNEEDAWMEGLAASALVDGMDAIGRFDRAALMALERPLARRVIRKWLGLVGVPVVSVTFAHMGRIYALAEKTQGSRAVSLPGPWRVVRRYGHLTVEQAAQGHDPLRVALNRPGETLIPEWGLRVVVQRSAGVVGERGESPGQLPAQASLSVAAVRRRRLYLRTLRVGDRMQPYGMRGSKKLQDILVDAKVPADQRGGIPVLECGGEIAWLPGYRIAHPFRVMDEDAAALHIRVERL
ncbi:MAG: tRNA lysidine(34) synthetase TilS [Verrucomicrobia bacterium]|nr:tRNA lysidine(34) synthetase TilS [Verrucomicrobiota bacterium]MBT7066799.1 tRNA lysidine(34) synthetase TilS [Verrucomicrobiota bacterium]MBT7701458.1 tRNA lysidine(34) synthetase TilS [Verrucomicrobiota bacterium]